MGTEILKYDNETEGEIKKRRMNVERSTFDTKKNKSCPVTLSCPVKSVTHVSRQSVSKSTVLVSPAGVFFRTHEHENSKIEIRQTNTGRRLE